MFRKTKKPSDSRNPRTKELLRSDKTPAPAPQLPLLQGIQTGDGSLTTTQSLSHELRTFLDDSIMSSPNLRPNGSFSAPATARRLLNVKGEAQFVPPSGLADRRSKLGYDPMEGTDVKILIQGKRTLLEAKKLSSSSSDWRRRGPTPTSVECAQRRRPSQFSTKSTTPSYMSSQGYLPETTGLPEDYDGSFNSPQGEPHSATAQNPPHRPSPPSSVQTAQFPHRNQNPTFALTRIQPVFYPEYVHPKGQANNPAAQPKQRPRTREKVTDLLIEKLRR